MSVDKNIQGKWFSDLDDSRQFNSRLGAINYEKRLEFKEIEKAAGDERQLSELIDIWHKLHGKALKDGTRRYLLLHRISKSLCNPIAATFRAEHFANYRESRSSEITTTTMNREHAYLRALFNELLRLGVIKYENPLSHIRQFKEVEGIIRFLTGDEIARLLKHCAESSNESLIHVVRICLSTGSRWGEAEGIMMTHLVNRQVTFM